MDELSTQNQYTNFLIYTAPSGDVRIETLLQNETLWLTQKQMESLFDVKKSTLSEHFNNIFSSGELVRDATVRKFRTVQNEGGREVSRNIEHYNLDAILSVGYRVNSRQATQFRLWASKILKGYIIKGFAMDDDRLKNGQYFGKDYFQELLERVRSIRASERRIYQKVTDVFAECCLDYDNKSETAKHFYAHVQHQFHFAITGQTAAEIVFTRVDSSKEKAGMTTYKHAPDGRVLKSDVVIAKNYLQEDEIKKLERTISSYFDYIENQIEQHQTLSMEAFSQSVDKFLSFNDFKVLDGFGSVSHQQAKQKAHREYDQ
ncbi:MAG: virulence RhuM family protein, partial [Mariprofundaceae bacterium]|nr:virulence RhuM family protein [Mariprofundaceae bacterium]